ncbi:hypothetical protein DOTSEDRAFT_121863 [Dothistroma septosporum NZE10]|uniref:Rab proteins geranylgeranyltransferase n=1 Tax=Dothistroma septosporum (strain NZE10 / CBS 128990) TaxID=675120 RepID=N1Q391_DOTSN|nr:hypothetical protein DOTSEDRAFT_121863 [Dothistroma septosporum NZE10]
MESLEVTNWDVVISGTGLTQSLLALSLSRSDKKILHVDRNEYYGGDEAALSLSEAEVWAQEHASEQKIAGSGFSHASVTKVADDQASASTRLGPARAYSLALAPKLLYTRSTLLPALVSSRTHSQLEFQAVGSWFIVGEGPDDSSTRAQLIRVPGGREDVFQDKSLDLKAKRSLMKFLRFVVSYEEQRDTWHEDRSKEFSVFLQEKFGLPPSSHAPILALALSHRAMQDITVEYALPRVSRHLNSIGLFGPGFCAVLPKWGGLAEIAQVACRSCAVGGGVYVLGRGITDVQPDEDFNLRVELSDGQVVTTKWLAGLQQDLPGTAPATEVRIPLKKTSNIVSVISSSLDSLFPPTSESGVTPAGAVVMVKPADEMSSTMHIFVHSSESGECPTGQCVLYASCSEEGRFGFQRLEQAVTQLLGSVNEPTTPQVLWSLQYQRQVRGACTAAVQRTGPVVTLQSLSDDLAFEDAVLEGVKTAWEQIVGSVADDYLKFEAREGQDEEES